MTKWCAANRIAHTHTYTHTHTYIVCVCDLFLFDQGYDSGAVDIWSPSNLDLDQNGVSEKLRVNS